MIIIGLVLLIAAAVFGLDLIWKNHHKCQPSAILRRTAEHSPGDAYPGDVATYINGVFRGTIAVTADMLAGLHLYLPH